MTRKATIDTGRIGTISAVLPAWSRAKGFHRAPVAVGYGFRPDGTAETPADAEAFAAAILASADAMRAREDARPLPAGTGKRTYAASAARAAREHAPILALAERFRNRDRVASRAAGQRALAAYRASQAATDDAAEIERTEELMRATDAPRAEFPTTATNAPDTTADDLGYSYRESVRDALTAAAPDALSVCNACELRPMVGPEHPGYAAGYCAECYQDATAPEPEPAPAPDPCPICGGDHDRISREDCPQYAPGPPANPAPEPETAPESTAEPIAASRAILAAVPSAAGRPTCERCGQTFRLNGRGYAWHVANRPQCAGTGKAAAA